MTSEIDQKSTFEVQKVVEDIIVRLEQEARRQRGLPAFRSVRQLSASSHTADRVQGNDVQTLNENELKSVYALLAYVAHNENIQQETVQSLVEASFGVNHVTKLPQKDYDDVIRFLVDLRIDELKD